MCLLTYVSPDATISEDHAVTAAVNNPDGFGWAIVATDDTIVRYRSMSFEDAWVAWERARDRWHDGPALWHWRYATGGKMTVHNAHPFEVGGDPRLIMGHNGVLPIRPSKRRSDTRILAEDVLAAEDRKNWDDDDWLRDLDKWLGGDKLVFLSVHPEMQYQAYIVGEQRGHWSDGVWYSNRSYVPRPVVADWRDWQPAGAPAVTLADDEIECQVCRGIVEWDPRSGDDVCPFCLSCLMCEMGEDDCLCGPSWGDDDAWRWDDVHALEV